MRDIGEGEASLLSSNSVVKFVTWFPISKSNIAESENVIYKSKNV